MSKSENLENKRLLGLDTGSKRHGLAVWNPKAKLIKTLPSYKKSKLSQDIQFYKNLVLEEEIEAVIMGYPTPSQTKASESSSNAKFWKQQLESQVLIPCFFQEEKFSSIEAQHLVEQKALDAKNGTDSVAAAIILERFLNLPKPDNLK